MRCGYEITKNQGLFNNLSKSDVNNKNFYVFGKGLDTKDGTAIRDFIYISDLSEVHYKFAKIIKKQKIKIIINCGYGKGYSVLEVINQFNIYLNKKINFFFKDRRKGDIEYSVANTKKLKKFHNFKNKKNRLSLMIETSLKWYKKSLKT